MATNTIVSTLGAGSGIDIKTLAENLVEAEKKPFKERIDARISKTEARISGYAGLKYSVGQLKSAFEKLNDASEFGGLKVSNNQTAALNVTAASGAASASYDIAVLQLAAGQRSRSQGFASGSAPLNAGSTIDLKLTVGGTLHTLAGVTDTPQAVAAAINAYSSSNSLGVTAELVRRSENGNMVYALEMQGASGADKGFALEVDAASVQSGVTAPQLIQTTLETASDARVRVNGQLHTRTSNTLTGVISNVTLDLVATTSGTARVAVGRDTQATKDNIKALVSAYNDFEEAIKILGDSKSDVEGVGGTLAGDRLLRSIRAEIRNLLVSNSSTVSGTIKAARDVGLSLDRTGRMVLNETTLDLALANSYSDVTQMFTAGTNNKSLFSPAAAGLAGDAVVTLDKMLRSTGSIAKQTDSATKDLAKYKADLEKLEERMSKAFDRYIEQFSIMESMVGSANSLRENMKSSFEGMMAAYTNK